MEIHDRIRKIRNQYFQGSNSSFAEYMGELTATTSGWVSGRRGVGKNVLDKILTKFPEINANWLISGQGEMLTVNIEHTNMINSLSGNPPVNEGSEINSYHMNINERLQVIVDEKFHGNKAAFARSLDVPVASVGNYFGDKVSTPSSELLEKIVNNIPNVNPYWLLTGNGAPFFDIKKDDIAQSLSQITSTRDVSVDVLIKCIENLSEADKVRANAQYEQAEANNRYSRVIEKLADRLDTPFSDNKKEGTNS